MKHSFYLASVLLLLVGLGASTASALSFGDSVDSINIEDVNVDSAGNVDVKNIKLEDSTDSIKVDSLKTDGSGNVELKGVEVKDSVDSVNADSLKVDSSGKFEAKGVNLDDSTDSIKIDSATGQLEDFDITIEADKIETSSEDAVRIESASEIKTTEDLKVFVSSSIEEDAAIKSVEFKNENVEIKYSMPARFLAIIPMRVPYKVEVNEKNEVEVSLPWWHIFTWKKAKAAEVETEVEANLADDAPAVSASATASAKLQSKAQTFSIVINSLSVEIK